MRLIDDDGHGVELRVTGYQFPDATDLGQRYSWHQVEGHAVTPEGSWTFRYPALTCDETVRVGAWLRRVARGEAVAALSFTEPNLTFAVASDGLDVGLAQEFAPPAGPSPAPDGIRDQPRRAETDGPGGLTPARTPRAAPRAAAMKVTAASSVVVPGRTCSVRCRLTDEDLVRAADEWDAEIVAWPDGLVLHAVSAEAARLVDVLAELTPTQWNRPTACEPWTVAELAAHVVTALGRVPGMIAAPAPERAEVTAAGYYRADERFSAGTNAERVDVARQRAAGGTVTRDLDACWREVVRLCAAEPASRVVRTRHGDAMLLTDFLTTRVVELAVHGLDLAAALGRAPWLTDPAADLLTPLLRGEDTRIVADLGWDRATFLAKATNRQPLTPQENERLTEAGIRWLALG